MAFLDFLKKKKAPEEEDFGMGDFGTGDEFFPPPPGGGPMPPPNIATQPRGPPPAPAVRSRASIPGAS